MWDSESDFMYRYDWERGERELRLAKRRRIRESIFGLILPWSRKRSLNNHDWSNIGGIAIGALILVSVILVAFNMNHEGSSLKDASGRLTSLETNYDVNVTQAWDSEGVDKPLQVEALYKNSKVHCGLPVLSELESKPYLRCDNGVTIPPK